MTPPHRIEIDKSSRHVRIEISGVTVAESREPRILTETGCPPRYYLPRRDVRAELRPSEHRTTCPFKGTAVYWDVQVGDRVYPNHVWGYPEPLAERAEIAGLVCFYNEQVDLYLDGELQPR